jgi:hypothetical protein
MNELNLVDINAYNEGQPVIKVNGTAYPIGIDTRNCTATAADILAGKTAAVSNGIVVGTATFGGRWW